MTWDEPWRREESADPSEIPAEYNGLRPSGRGRIVATYFVGLFLAFYVALRLVGGQAMLIFGFPLLMWMAIVLILLVLTGLYFFAWEAEVQTMSSTESETEVSEEAAD